ncbi:MAG: succinate dehydrogenase assembly factor 2 [Candidatus Endonucleobacter bathymodioli]|uniref:FAD assembly factor SdhE n=1 Tax=Candidatus Endonucleibacter bathymodioli TaxID=539814 RepID=A0AA90SRQ1_9GAMM|nr:succinate dehydrogenase assembly factor 2 [Candidatus Endonucleobacter bathymodioli]
MSVECFEDLYKCLQWRSRRGMLELDVLLEPFTRDLFCSLSAEDQGAYARLLECEDPDLFNWFMTDQRPREPELARMVDKVLQSSCYADPA